MTDSAVGPTRKIKRGRSPSYPGVSLDMAIERARVLYQHEKQYPAPVDTVLSHWGYKPGVGPGLVTVAALRKYGLLESEGNNKDRMVRLTDLALDLLLDPDPSSELIFTAAMGPEIHQEMWEQYGAVLPSDATLKHELVRNRGFTDRGADEFIAQYRRTLAFANLRDAGRIEASEGDEEDDAMVIVEERRAQSAPALRERSGVGAAPAPIPGTTSIPIPLVGGESVQVVGHFPISEEAWKHLMSVLEVMKPGLVSAPENRPQFATQDHDDDAELVRPDRQQT